MTTDIDLDREPSITSSEQTTFSLRTLSSGYWRFLSASVFFDFGFGLFFFLFNLYLATIGFQEARIGMFTSMFTLGSLLATWPAGLAARRYGLRPLIVLTMIVAPAVAALRVFALTPSSQALAALLLGVSMCGWAVCTPTALARLTTTGNRATGFSINFGVGIGTGVLAGIIGGNLPSRFSGWTRLTSPAIGMRFTLLFACLLVTLGSLPLARSAFPAALESVKTTVLPARPTHRRLIFQLVAAAAMWNSIAAAFAPFVSIYMVRRLGISLAHAGEVFATSQLLQVLTVLSTPLLQRRQSVGKIIVAIQLSATAMLLLLSRTTSPASAIPETVLLYAFLYMAGPSIYSLLMTLAPDCERSLASAALSIASSLFGVAASAIAGIVVGRYGYPMLFSGLALTSLASAVLFSALAPGLKRASGATRPLV